MLGLLGHTLVQVQDYLSLCSACETEAVLQSMAIGLGTRCTGILRARLVPPSNMVAPHQQGSFLFLKIYTFLFLFLFLFFKVLDSATPDTRASWEARQRERCGMHLAFLAHLASCRKPHTLATFRRSSFSSLASLGRCALRVE